jgi:hypothetical protein
MGAVNEGLCASVAKPFFAGLAASIFWNNPRKLRNKVDGSIAVLTTAFVFKY